jgi:hypothetical protein
MRYFMLLISRMFNLKQQEKKGKYNGKKNIIKKSKSIKSFI